LKKKILRSLLSISLALGVVIAPIINLNVNASIMEYEHDPSLNVNVMEDVIVDPNAVYGYRPDPNSDRLGTFADLDWTDKAKVAEWTKERIEYHNEFNTMYDTWKNMEKQGKSIEEIARRVSAMRNELRLASYDGDPVGLARVKESNLKKYGNENGPTAESLYKKYGSWEKVLIKSFSENPGMDACLGLYDIFYDTYSKVDSLIEETEQTYVVKKGDSLSKIAEKYYGDSDKWTKIYSVNQADIENPNVISIGQIIKVEMK